MFWSISVELWSFLKKLHIISDTSHVHEKFGNIDRILKKVNFLFESFILNINIFVYPRKLIL